MNVDLFSDTNIFRVWIKQTTRKYLFLIWEKNVDLDTALIFLLGQKNRHWWPWFNGTAQGTTQLTMQLLSVLYRRVGHSLIYSCLVVEFEPITFQSWDVNVANLIKSSFAQLKESIKLLMSKTIMLWVEHLYITIYLSEMSFFVAYFTQIKA